MIGLSRETRRRDADAVPQRCWNRLIGPSRIVFEQVDGTGGCTVTQINSAPGFTLEAEIREFLGNLFQFRLTLSNYVVGAQSEEISMMRGNT